MLMQHEDAIRTHAAERYLLGEMGPDERELYEEHYFSCERCGNELSATAAFLDNARVVLTPLVSPMAGAGPSASIGVAGATRHGSERRNGSWWQRVFGAPRHGLVPALGFAVAVLVAVVGYQNLAVIPDLREQLAGRDVAQGVPTVALRSAARGTGPRLLLNTTHTYAVLQADVLPEPGVKSYTASLVAADGREQFRTSLAAPEIGLPVTLLVPVRDLAPGDYTLVFHEGDATGREAGRFIFTLERQ
jgi:hypothetical protein